MEKEFIQYEQALELKELGFDEECFGYYDNEGLKVSSDWYSNPHNKNSLFPESHTTNNPKISAPLYQQAFRWFRDNILCDGSISRYGDADGEYSYRWDIINEYGLYQERHFKKGYNNYEEAELACLKKLIKIVKKK